ncbi:MAG: metalloregulator ArsR/SmtB family transcription factor [Candidatus Celaenobacter polaris]|nr:metalloregulator ArsR/SmtB family transcription factor [Candidatus Celaenobacter polaris]
MIYDIEKTSKILKALSHPGRLKIAIGLYHDECNVSACQKKMKLPQSTISQHLRTIKEAGICISRRDGNQVCYKVVDEFTIAIIKMIES